MTDVSQQDRKPRFWQSIYIRCTLLSAVATIVVAAVLSFGSARLLDNTVVKGLNAEALKTASGSADALVKPLRFNVADKIQEVTTGALDAAGAHGRAAVVFDQDGTERARSPDAGSDGDIARLIELAEAARTNGQIEVADGGRLVAVPIVAEGDSSVAGVFTMAWSYDAVRAEQVQRVMTILGLAAVVFALMMGCSIFILRRVLAQPLEALAIEVARVSNGDYEQDISLRDRPDEIGAIANRLQHLLLTLRHAREAEEARAQDQAEQVDVVDQVASALNQLAEGVLSHRMTAELPEAYQTIRTNYNRAVERVEQVVYDVSHGAQSVQLHSNEIAHAALDLSSRTEKQAATLEESAAALQDLFDSVKATAAQTEGANDAVQATQKVAEKNSEVMSSTVTAMGAIKQSSDQISEIITLIEDIAFQTNLLALNAAVEAARAGASGKGFAVVASEVRNLAQRSADAAQQINELINRSATQVQEGVQLVETAGDALDSVVEQVSGIATMIQTVSASAHQQAQGLHEINEGISSLDQVTQRNAAMVEESSAAADQLRQDAVSLADVIGYFTTGDAQDVVRDEALPEAHSQEAA